MNFSLSQFRREYDTELFPVKIEGRELNFLRPRSIDRFINPDNPIEGFPLWAKFWEASAVLTHFMAELPVDPQRRILELGSGLGIAGITAAVLGHTITLTEYDQDALNFLRANASLNGCDHAAVRPLDWFQPQLEGQFDLIIGSEIIYQEAAVQALEALFQKYLARDGRVVLAERVRATGTLFFQRLSDHFNIRAKKHTLSSAGEKETVILFDMTPKSQ